MSYCEAVRCSVLQRVIFEFVQACVRACVCVSIGAGTFVYMYAYGCLHVHERKCLYVCLYITTMIDVERIKCK